MQSPLESIHDVSHMKSDRSRVEEKKLEREVKIVFFQTSAHLANCCMKYTSLWDRQFQESHKTFHLRPFYCQHFKGIGTRTKPRM